MNYSLFFLCISLTILVLSLVTICVSPIINNVEKGEWSFSSWRTLNCQYFADKEKSEDVKLDEIQKFKKLTTLCKTRKAMHDLEYASLIINVVLSFVCSNLSLLHYLNVGKDFEKKTGMIGFITGIIGFILTLVYVCYNGYIFNNDIAFGEYDIDSGDYSGDNVIEKLFPNGAKKKKEKTNSFIFAYENEKDDFSEYVKYKDLGKKQYNYDKQYYEKFKTSSKCICIHDNNNDEHCNDDNDCDYIYYFPYPDNTNKYLYDRWLTTLILGVIIVICNIGLLIFGFLLFKNVKGDSSDGQTVPIA